MYTSDYSLVAAVSLTKNMVKSSVVVPKRLSRIVKATEEEHFISLYVIGILKILMRYKGKYEATPLTGVVSY